MRIDAKIDVLGLVDKTTKAQKNLAYSVAQGINAPARKIQDAQRDRLRERFTLRTARTKQFLERAAAVIKPWASVNQGRLFAEVAVGQRQRLLLADYEDGAERKPFKGRLIAQPVAGGPARKNFAAPVSPSFTFAQLKLRAQQTRESGATQYKGRQRTFTIPGVEVFQRTGRERGDIELVYAFAEKQRLPAKLGWQKTARDVADRWLSESITQAFLKSLPRS